MRRTYHVLTESEPFSEYFGGAISRWAANVLREDGAAIILAPSADQSWGVPAERVRTLRGLARYASLRPGIRTRIPWALRRRLLEQVLHRGLHDIKQGDVVWIHNRPDFAAALSPALKRVPRLVLHMHNSHLVTWPNQGTKRIGADNVVFVSRFLEQEARQRHPALSPTTALYNGADENVFFPRQQSVNASARTKILFAGRLVPEKGVHVLLGAMKLLYEKNIAADALIVGGSPGSAGATKYVSGLHRDAPPNVTFKPYCSGTALAELFREADIFCCPSVWDEAFGMVNVEAMACKLPTVASRSGGIPEIFSEGGGLVVERGSERALAEALESLVTDPSLRIRLGQEGYDSFRRNFTWSAVRENYNQILERL